MIAYQGAVAMLNFFVDYLLLLGTNRLCGYPPGWGRSAIAASIGGIHSAACMLQDFRFLGNTLWRFVILGIVGWMAFGFHKSTFRRTIVFILLCMALGGVAQGLGSDRIQSLVISAIIICSMCFLGFRNRPGSVSYVPVELKYGEKKMCFTALCDSGNTLTDPITGRPVLVVSAEVAQHLVDLTPEELRNPLSAIRAANVPGLRLIPYRSIGQPLGMLLALRFSQVRIGKWRGSTLVAFAPDGFGNEGQYQALTGGAA